jgi:Inositol polyphosphate kinase
MRFYDPTHADADIKGYRYYEKSYGRSLTTRTELMEAFQLFFSAGCSLPETDNCDGANGVSNNNSPSKQSSSPSLLTSSRIRRRTISNILVQLRPIRRWFEENKSLRFYASSLLFIYEGDVTNSPNPDMTTVKMIDFGRVRRESGGDQGYITGLSTVKNIFADLLNDDEQQMNDSVKEK